ncbi:amidase [Pseudolabrys taiwanensis]|uniref:Amidase n=1 Tax=Pseudolabrys taiwanensis TaxID=331696 RepID=A0A346A1U4_9HYPH|nr:amidase [Pseudolabrys taiwanensis]AXK83141.1 amidase [Pseudolabrys taiwanensis]
MPPPLRYESWSPQRYPITGCQMPHDDVAQKSASEMSRLLEQKQVSALEIVDAVLARNARLHPALNACIDVDADAARAAARQSDRRRRDARSLGPLDGIPVTVKDNLAVKGMKATWGSKALAHRIAPHDDPSVALLRAAGAVIWAKTNLPELALAGVTDNELFGATRNPWDTSLTPGGSSGGAAAALAAGIGPLALATDAGGSARRPAAYTGTVGLRPSNGMIPRGSFFPTTTSDCQVVAPMARSIADIRMTLDVLAAPHVNDRTSSTSLLPAATRPPSDRPLRILYFSAVGSSPVDDRIAAALDTAAGRLSDMGHDVISDAAPFSLEEIEAIWSALIGAGTAAAVTASALPLAELTPTIRGLVDRGTKLSAAQYVEAIESINRIRRQFDELFERYDVLLSPTSPCFPWSTTEPYPKVIGGKDAGPRGAATFLPFVNVAGIPAISLPIGDIETPLPVGMQLAAAFGADRSLLRLAEAIEARHPWPATAPAFA